MVSLDILLRMVQAASRGSHSQFPVTMRNNLLVASLTHTPLPQLPSQMEGYITILTRRAVHQGFLRDLAHAVLQQVSPPPSALIPISVHRQRRNMSAVSA